MPNEMEFIASSLSEPGLASVVRMPLTEGWTFRQVGTTDWFSAQVPGNNFSDLLRNDQIQHPFHRDHEKHLQWIQEKDWEYKLAFELTEAQLNYAGLKLECEGLDTFAEIWLNEQLILESNNMFRAWQAEVKSLLKIGANELRILFHSPLKKVRPEAQKVGLIYPAGNDHSTEKLSVFARKAPYHYGWDWGPRFVTSGIWRPITLVAYPGLQIEGVQLSSAPKGGSAFELTAEVDCLVMKEGHYHLSIYLDELGEMVSLNRNLAAGRHKLVANMNLFEVRRWYPRGMGEPYLYDVRVDFEGPDAQTDRQSMKHGFREIDLIREPDAEGTTFYFRVNGKAIFAKGANYIPQDSFLDQVGTERYRKLFEDVVEAGMNMIRVWGGGIYEESWFYELADEMGIMIWQDFMFACTMYPGDEAFLENVRQEAISQVKRLRNHPSIALWCGNNEIRVGWDNWGWQEEYQYNAEQEKKLLSDYNRLFEDLLAKVVSEYAPEICYLPSSPVYDYADLDNYKHGDVHYWGVWHELAPFSEYRERIPRFMSEYGFQSFPLIDSVKKYTVEADWDIDSEVMKIHQKHPRGNRIIKEYLEKDYRDPKDFTSFLYLSQLLQAGGIRMAIEAYRQAKPFCMGSLYWQLNDCWPVASWAGIDYYGKWKALHYFVKKAYQEIILIMDQDEKGIWFEVLSDRFADVNLTVDIRMMTLDGKLLDQQQTSVKLVDNGKVKLEWQGTMPETTSNCLFFGQIQENGQAIYENTFYLVPPKDLHLQATTVKWEVEKQGADHLVSVQSEGLVKNLYLHTEDGKGHFSDNFFDLIPGQVKKVLLSGTDQPAIHLQSVFETYQ
ncbi:MAG: glycoside hydrolase family 2 protein [Bacteroidota bacterium]